MTQEIFLFPKFATFGGKGYFAADGTPRLYFNILLNLWKTRVSRGIWVSQSKQHETVRIKRKFLGIWIEC